MMKWVVFDIDGVLIDVSESFDRAVQETVKSLTGGGKYPSLECVRKVRKQGSFVDDFKLAEAFIISSLSPDGLMNAMSQGTNIHGIRMRNTAGVDASRVKNVFNEYYLGTSKPGSFTDEGLWREERPIIDTMVLQEVVEEYEVGVVTGRDRLELQLAETIIGWTFDNVVTRDEVTKPDPEALTLLGVDDAGIYFGDTMNDQLLVRRFNEMGGNVDFVMIGTDYEDVNEGIAEELF